MRVLERSSLEAYLFALVGIAAAAFPMTWYFRAFLVLVLAGIIVDLIIRSPLTATWRWRPKLFCSVAALCLLGAAAWRPIYDDYRGVERPDVTLRFVWAESPAVQLNNHSDVVAQQVLWDVVLWNFDDPRAYSNPTGPDMADKHEPLPFPSATVDFIRPHSEVGPLNIFNDPRVAPYIKKGNRLFGSAIVTCPTCERGHTVVVYIELGKRGWYHEMADNRDGTLTIPKRLTKTMVVQYFEELSAKISPNDRTPITDLF